MSDGDERANGTGAAGGSGRTVPEVAEPDDGNDLGELAEGADARGAEDDADLDLDPAARLRTALPPRLESWRRRSAAGAILTGIGLGLKAALEPERDEPSIVMQATGDPPTDLSVEAELGGILPADNVVRIRPWLLTQAGQDHLESGAGSTTQAVGAPQPVDGAPVDGATDTP